MSFAQKILQKYGWKEGEGLGKNSDGISKPLKASLKFDNSGFGVDKAADFNNHWWERVFNEAANNVKVKKDGENVSVATNNEDSVEITTKEYSVRKLKKMKQDTYGNFLSSATLTNTGDEVIKQDKIDVDDIKIAAYKPLTDEELFAACGGRTAHKGARHGLKLSGKLSRIEQQEKELLAKMQTDNPTEYSESWTTVKSKKKKKNKEHTKQNDPTEDDPKLNEILFTADYCIKSKKKRKEKKKIEEELSKCLDSCSMEKPQETGELLKLCDSSKTIKKSKKNKKLKNHKSSDDSATYREAKEIDTEEQSEEVEAQDQIVNEEIEEQPVLSKKKNKKCKHGIDKDAKEAHKQAKKLKRKLKNITEEFDRSVLVAA